MSFEGGLRGLRSRYYSLARRLGAPRRYERFRTAAYHDGSSHVEMVGDLYYYVVTERGAELQRRSTADPEEILYWLISDLTWKIASDYELSHRRAGQDFRRILFAKQIELLNGVKSEWAARRQREQETVLCEHPFVDS